MACTESKETVPDVITNVELNLSEILNTAIVTTCDKFTQHIKFSQMKKIFRVIYNENPESLKVIHEQLCSQMKKSILEDLDELCKEQCMDVMLKSLETIKQDQKSSQRTWRPSGNPEEDLRDHIYPLKLKHKEDLEAVLTKLQLSNEELINEVSVNHAEILHLKECRDDLYKAVSNIISSFTGSNLKTLTETLTSVAAP